jgi:hypothetical protein
MSFRRHLIGSLAAAAILAPAFVKADAPAAKWYDKVSVSGYAESDYSVWLNQPGAYGNTTVPLRVFDKVPNQFQYGGELILGYTDPSSKTGANIDLLLGDKNLVNSFGLSGNDNEAGISIGQANLTQILGPVTFTIGKFATPIGYESWNTTANANYSRSILYSQEPFYSVGAKLDYAAPWGITGSLWTDNGNSINQTNSDAKNWGVALNYTGVKDLTLNAQWYEDFSSEGFNTTLNNNTGYFEPVYSFDFNLAYTLNAKFNFGAEYLYQTFIDNAGAWEAANLGYTQKNSPKDQGYALYATYNTPVSNLSVNGRFEQWFQPDVNYNQTQYSADNGYYALGINQMNLFQLDDYTLTVKYVAGSLSHILEYRADAANGYIFQTKGNNVTASDHSQIDQTVTYAAVYSF